MDATKVTIPGIFNGSRLLEIPFYQRAYVWDEPEWARFLEDMKYVSSVDRPYFVGSIILKAYTGPTGESISEHRVVIDGQQRLTTLMLFFKVLSLKTGHPEWFARDFILEDGSIALQHGKNDEEIFKQAVYMKELSEIDADGSSVSKIAHAFNWFIKQLNPEDFDRNIVKKNVQFVCIDLGDDEDEQQIFDTINSLGVRLTTAELLKNYLFSRNDKEEYEQSWVPIFEQDDETKAFWDTVVQAGRYEYTLIELFFNALLQIKARDGSYDVSVEHRLAFNRNEQLFSSYKIFIGEYMGDDKHAFLDEMKEYAVLFRELFNPATCERSIGQTNARDRMNILVFGLENLTIVPYVLYMKHAITDEETFNDMLSLLESYIMRRILARANNRSYSLLFLSFIQSKVVNRRLFIEQMEKQNDQAAYYPDDGETMEAFSASRLTNKVAKGVLYLLESGIRPEESSTMLLGLNSYSLEHMMPKKWRNKWKDISINSDEASDRDKYLLTLGNLTLITQPLNSSIRDSEWHIKLKGKNGKPGLAECASGLATMHGALALDAWNKNTIGKRAKQLAKDALKVWPDIPLDS